MKVLVFTRYDELGASSRLRFYNFSKYFKQNNIELVFSPLFDSRYLKNRYLGKRNSPLYILWRYFLRLISLFRVLSYQKIWIEKELFPGLPALFEKILSWLKIEMITDYDDAIFLNYSNSKFFKDKIKTVMSVSKTVLCGSPFLKQYAENSNAQDIILVPTTVLKGPDGPLIKEKNKIFKIGWIGTVFTQKYLKELESIFFELQALKIPFEVHVMGGGKTFDEFPARYHTWSLGEEKKFLANIDIGIMPLQDSDWEKGKCGLKLIQYMSYSRPVIASNIGMNQKIVNHKENGFLVDSKKDWLNYLNQFITMDDSSWYKFQKNSFKTYSEIYSFDKIKKQLLNIFKENSLNNLLEEKHVHRNTN